MKVIVISSPISMPKEAERITQLFDSGLNLFHLRKPAVTVGDLKKIVEKIPSHYHDRVAFHQHHDWALQHGFRRLHFPAKVRLELSKKHIEGFMHQTHALSTSIHHPNQINQLGDAFSYTFLGPVFPSISKPGYGPKINLLENDLPSTITQLIALGGITSSSIRKIKTAGFDGIGLLGAIWSASPRSGLDQFQKCMQTIENFA